MHILEQYALNCGLKIGKPYIFEKYFPIPFDKYITFNPFGKFNSRKYSYWQEVIDLIYPALQKENIQIVQIGGPNEPAYNKCLNVAGNTNYNQTAYIIKNSLLHFGVDSFPIHIASYYNKKIVGLYSNMYSSQSRPYWSTPENIELIQADLKNKKPSYSAEESPKIIDFIKPEKISNSILSLLNIKNENKHETIFIGNRYSQMLLESTPSIIIPPNLFSNVLLNIRYDYIDQIQENDYICTLNNLNIRNCSIITDKPFEIEKLAQLKNKISNIFYDITENNIDIDFINKVKFLGIKIDFIFNKSKNSDENILNSKKLDLIDFPELINVIEETEKPVDLIKTSTFYTSKKILFANNKTYLSKTAYLENKPFALENEWVQNLNEIKNIDQLIQEDGDYCLFYK
jgi:hypothetical protein